jgi:speckle-type POZ protein
MPTYDSASAIIGGSVTGSHLLHIEGYSRTKLFAGGQRVGSQSFSVGGREWRLDYVPNPIDLQISLYNQYINLKLVLIDSVPDPVCARARFALLDQAGNEVPAYTQSIGWDDYMVSGYGHGVLISKHEMEASPGLVVNDCFKVRCHVDVLKSFRKENRGQWMTVPSVVPPSDLHQHLGHHLVTKEGADVTFQVAGETFIAHKCILAARSPVFKAQFLGAMKESTNAEHCGIRIHDMVPQAFDALLHFIYTDSLPGGDDRARR